MRSGADKVSLNTILTENPAILTEASRRIGSRALVGAIDAKRTNGSWIAHVKSGTEETQHDAIDWARTLVDYGVGKLLVTSIDKDGMKAGYDLELLARLSEIARVPIVASGGAGSKEHMRDAFTIGKADVVLAASVFHFNEHPIHELKLYLQSQDIHMRL